MLHYYQIKTHWTGNTGLGTTHVRSYDRSHTVYNTGKPSLQLTTDNKQVGDKTKLNPEDLLVSAISSCHMLSYLYLCALHGIIIHSYTDEAHGCMIENEQGGGAFSEVTLHPRMTVESESMIEKAIALHQQAHEICYIANSVNFPIHCIPSCHVNL